MAGSSVEIANEFIRRAGADQRALTQMQLQKLVYIAHGWNLAIQGQPLTHDEPQAWTYGPVYRDLWDSLRQYGRSPVTREILNEEYLLGTFEDNPKGVAKASLNDQETKIIERVYRDYGKFHAFQLSALTHEPGSPWTKVFDSGVGKFSTIDNDLIKEHFIEIASAAA
jgi:uncharacterized phage-associated protein